MPAMSASPPVPLLPPPPPQTTFSPDGRWWWDATALRWMPAPPGGHSTALLPVAQALLASPARRFSGFLLSFVLTIVTLVIGYIVWAIVCWSRSTTPAKQLLGMRVIDARTGAPATTGQMWMRQVVWSLVLGVASGLTGGILGVVDGLLVFRDSRQRLLDQMAGTLVVRTDR